MSSYTKTSIVFLILFGMFFLSFGQDVNTFSDDKNSEIKSSSFEISKPKVETFKPKPTIGTKEVLISNGSFITHEGIGSSGSDYCMMQDATLGFGTYGYGAQISAGNSIADDFEVSFNMNPSHISFFAYQTGSGPPSTLNDIRYQVWDGDPSQGGNVIFGDLSTNKMESTEWINAWRIEESDPVENRAIMIIRADATNLVLAPGTYWLEFQVDGSGSSGPWCPPVTILGESITGNALQNLSGNWAPMLDGQTGTQQGIPFLIEYSGSSADLEMWEIIQPQSGVGLSSEEEIKIKIVNHSCFPKSGFDLTYSINGTTINELFSGTIGGDDSLTYTFNTLVDLSSVGSYEIEACVDMEWDENPGNDCLSKTVECLDSILPPQNLTAVIINGNDALLYWDPPEGYNNWLFWDDQENYSGIGLTSGGVFYCASRWEPNDLSSYDGQYLTKIAYFVYDDNVNFEMMVWKGWDADTLLLSQLVNSSVVGEWNEIELDTPVLIDATDELWFGYKVSQLPGFSPAGHDFGPAISYKGDMISLYGVDWVSMSVEYSLDYNWNLAGFVSNSADGKETAIPLEKKYISNQPALISQDIKLESADRLLKPQSKKPNKELLSYNIYQDSILIGNTTEEEFYIYDLFPTSYEFFVTAVYDEGESEPSNIVSIIGCLPTPQNPSATIFNDVNVHLECDSMYYTPDHYNFYRDYTLIGTNVGPEFVDPYLFPGNYEYYITAQYDDEESFYYDILSVEILPPPPPPTLTAEYQEPNLEINWNAWTYGIDTALYNVYYSYEGGMWQLMDVTSDTIYYDSPEISGLHCYQISVVNAWPEPVFSNEACETVIQVNEYTTTEIQIFPNPATDNINVAANFKISSVKIYDVRGILVLKEQIDNTIFQTSSNALKPGLYFLKIETKKGTFTYKVIIE